MRVWVPDRAYFEPAAMEYSLGQEIRQRLQDMDVEILTTTSHNRITGIPGNTELQVYANSKRTLVVGVRKTLKFDSSKPSAEYAIPISTGCLGHCHYCYLQTTLGAKPYVRVYVNIEDILAQAAQYIEERKPEITRFEAACTSDPLSLEHITGNLKRLIEFMADQEYGRLRFVTKYDQVDSLLGIRHNGHTRFRFSVNADYVIKNFEPSTARLDERITAARKVALAGYPLGFIIAPIYLYDGWEEGYTTLVKRLADAIPTSVHANVSFELIQHRFTKPAKRVIEKHYPKTKLDLDETKRKMKWGRYGIYKYVYPHTEQDRIRELLGSLINTHFPEAELEYFT
ncbi:spore photoproduct lyase [Alicyclobacillus ferrooxydans]|uniref:Spore photoproduct lyase n=1 Tax=Alicyclobacillus ferrooxydans TaxID=471514 RepID=A0A0P9CV49_9BACL|nr:spore photoproduct lyase [Alicyclobacillus ferrooxydans]KPV40542.1 spore photoproduct lyase [Alicyclobacillus ferrooxydans]